MNNIIYCYVKDNFGSDSNKSFYQLVSMKAFLT